MVALNLEEKQIMPPRCSADGSTEAHALLESVELRTLVASDTICVRTRNNSYRLCLLDPETGRALVEGGRFFPEPVEAMVHGATFGGYLKVGWIGVGLRLEICANGQPIITSPVQSLSVEREIRGDQRGG